MRLIRSFSLRLSGSVVGVLMHVRSAGFLRICRSLVKSLRSRMRIITALRDFAVSLKLKVCFAGCLACALHSLFAACRFVLAMCSDTRQRIALHCLFLVFIATEYSFFLACYEAGADAAA